MKNFRVIVRGTGFELVVNGVSGLYGFNTPRFIEAEEQSMAKQLALAEVREKLGAYPGSDKAGSIAVESATEWTQSETKPGLVWYKQTTH